ncbi:trypsin-like cysteine/serine peptidase domain-containing protein [Aspergillus similis]
MPPMLRCLHPNEAVKLIHRSRGTLPGLTIAETRLLRKKQDRLRASRDALAMEATAYGEHITNALHATFIFAQAEAGTAVCIHRDGWLLACAHCFGEDEQEWQGNRYRWVLDYTGLAVQVECRVWDERRDLALARVLCVESEWENGTGDRDAGPAFVFAPIPVRGPFLSSPAPSQTPIICIGQPGSDDLESPTPRKTGYGLLEISEGRLQGLIPGADPQNNSIIGTLRHDAWTYWGHSGAPLVCKRTGVLLGLHSSWDDSTAMRHGVPLVAIQMFLDVHFLVGCMTRDAGSGEESEQRQ